MASRKLKAKMLPKAAPTVEELERRNRVFAQILALRDGMEPLGISVVDLIRADREELEQRGRSPDVRP